MPRKLTRDQEMMLRAYVGEFHDYMREKNSMPSYVKRQARDDLNSQVMPILRWMAADWAIEQLEENAEAINAEADEEAE